MKVGVAVLNYNRLEMLKRCLGSLHDTMAGSSFDCLIWDAGSDDGSQEWLRDTRNISWVSGVEFDDPPDPGCWPRFSYAQTVNRAAQWLSKRCGIEFFYPLNNDTIATSHWLGPCLETFTSDPTIGHVGSVVKYGPSSQPSMRNKAQSAGAFWVKWNNEWTTRSAYCMGQVVPDYVYDVDYAGFGMYRMDLFQQFGGLCEDYPPIYFDDPDWGLTLWTNGYRVVVDPRSVIIHDHLPLPDMYNEKERAHHFASIGPNKEKFLKKWSHILTPGGVRWSGLPHVVGC